MVEALSFLAYIKRFIKEADFKMPRSTFTIGLEKEFMITPTVKHFIFKSKDASVFKYIPGQFITIHFEHQGKSIKRSYSIANAPENNNRIEFAAGFVASGIGTEFLYHLKPEDEIEISGPYGRLILKEPNPRRYIFVATSTGITPFRAMMPELATRIKSNPQLNIIFIQGIKTKTDILYEEEFLSFTSQFPQVNFYACLSQEMNEISASHHRKGHVQDIFSELNLNTLTDLIYLCGNPNMIDDCFTRLKNDGFQSTQIIREKYISS